MSRDINWVIERRHRDGRWFGILAKDWTAHYHLALQFNANRGFDDSFRVLDRLLFHPSAIDPRIQPLFNARMPRDPSSCLEHKIRHGELRTPEYAHLQFFLARARQALTPLPGRGFHPDPGRRNTAAGLTGAEKNALNTLMLACNWVLTVPALNAHILRPADCARPNAPPAISRHQEMDLSQAEIDLLPAGPQSLRIIAGHQTS